MRRLTMLGAAVLALAGLAATARAQAQPSARAARPGQAPAATKREARPQAGASKAAQPAAANIVATVNGLPVTRDEVLRVYNEYEVPAGREAEFYEMAVEMLVNTKLLEQYLDKNVPVAKEEIEKALAEEESQLKQQNLDLATELARSNMTLDELRTRIRHRIQYRKFFLPKATDEALKAFVEKHEDVFNNNRVRASHILLKLPQGASEADKEKTRQKLLAIKQEIESGKITFADAANKYSQDDSNVATPNGGDLGEFARKGQFIEPFAAAAFALEEDQISEPVETEYGLHLIQVTDRKEGKPVDFEQLKEPIRNAFIADLEEKFVNELRAKAQITIKPMPANFFPPAPATAAPATGTPGAAPAPAPAPRANPGAQTKPAPTP